MTPKVSAAPARLLLPLALLGLLPLPAGAAKWTSLASDGNLRVEIDSASIDRSGEGRTRVWQRETYARKQTLESGAFSYTSAKLLNEFQCGKRLAAPLRRIYYAGETELLNQGFDGKDASPVVPDSVSEKVFNAACKPKGAPPGASKAAKEKKAAEAAAEAAKAEPEKAEAAAKTGAKKAKGGKAEAHAEEVHWTYEGKTGAAQWSTLKPDFAACAGGRMQSPIDIRGTIRADLPPIKFNYKPVPLSLVDNGHTIQVNTAGAGSIVVEGEEYEFLQFHFHRPSEERIDGKAYDMVAHLVHKSQAGKLAVVAVLLQAGKEHKLIRTLWSKLPLEKEKPVQPEGVNIDPAQLLPPPTTRSYYTYSGSLTTPPCSEGVLWLVMKTPVALSKEQIQGFGRLYKHNARPVQPGNARVIKEGR